MCKTLSTKYYKYYQENKNYKKKSFQKILKSF